MGVTEAGGGCGIAHARADLGEHRVVARRGVRKSAPRWVSFCKGRILGDPSFVERQISISKGVRTADHTPTFHLHSILAGRESHRQPGSAAMPQPPALRAPWAHPGGRGASRFMGPVVLARQLASPPTCLPRGSGSARCILPHDRTLNHPIFRVRRMRFPSAGFLTIDPRTKVTEAVR